MIKLRTLCWAIAAVVPFAGPSSAANDPDVTRLMAAQCIQCHGANGKSAGGILCLSGMDAEALYHVLLEIKHGEEDEVMYVLGKSFSEEQLARIADYYAAQPECEE